VVVYCSCPNEATAVRIAMALRKRGITRIRPLLGGLEAWRERNYPVVAHRHVTAEMIAGTA
jgi:rhodanese-related sulfurtransferase